MKKLWRSYDKIAVEKKRISLYWEIIDGEVWRDILKLELSLWGIRGVWGEDKIISSGGLFWTKKFPLSLEMMRLRGNFTAYLLPMEILWDIAWVFFYFFFFPSDKLGKFSLELRRLLLKTGWILSGTGYCAYYFNSLERGFLD